MSKWMGVGLLLLFLCFPQIAKNGISTGLDSGLNVLMPTLFPYLVASQIFLKTGGAELLSRFIKLPFLSKKSIGLLIPSLFCGYPTGARVSSFAYNNNEISKREFFRLFCYGNVPGFGFTVAYLGGILWNSYSMGIQIYISFLLASLLLCVLSGATDKNSKEKSLQTKNPKTLPFSSAVVESVLESSVSMVSLICFVCFFSSLICFLQTMLPSGILSSFCCALLEITAGLKLLSNGFPISFAVFFAGFGGLCVLFQSLSFDKKSAVNPMQLILARGIYGLVSVLIFWGIRFFFDWLI